MCRRGPGLVDMRRWLIVVGCLGFALPLLAHAYAGTASRYVGDDYCAGYIFRDYGFWGGQWWHYLNWNAQPTTLFLMGLTAPLGPMPWLSGLDLGVWVLAGTWTMHELSAWSRQVWSWPVCLLFAEMLIWATLQGAPNVAQSVYLRVPLLAYVVPLIGLTAYLGWLARLARLKSSRHRFVPYAALALAAFGPVPAVLLTVMSALAFFIRPTRHPVVLPSLVGSFVGLVLVAVAPGNAIRQAQFPGSPGFVFVGIDASLSAVFLSIRPVLGIMKPALQAIVPQMLGSSPGWLPAALEMQTSPLPLLIVVFASAFFVVRPYWSWPPSTAVRWACWWLPIVAILLVAVCMVPAWYGTSAPLPPRALIVPQFIMVCLAACWACAMALTWRIRLERFTPLLIGLILVGSIDSTRHILRQGVVLHQWAQAWDRIDLNLSEAPAGSDVTVPALARFAGVDSIGGQAWVNACAAHYYGLKSIAVR